MAGLKLQHTCGSICATQQIPKSSLHYIISSHSLCTTVVMQARMLQLQYSPPHSARCVSGWTNQIKSAGERGNKEPLRRLRHLCNMNICDATTAHPALQRKQGKSSQHLLIRDVLLRGSVHIFVCLHKLSSSSFLLFRLCQITTWMTLI